MSADGNGIRASVDELIRLRLRARSIHLESLRRATSSPAGLQFSKFRGRGIDYEESRNYQPGDDIRAMDWRVTARTGRPHTKVFQEERERPVIVMVDFSPSMFFGTQVAFKSVIAVRAATVISWAAVLAGDRIGAFLFSHRLHHEVQPAGGRRGVLRVIRDFADWANPDKYANVIEQGSLGSALHRLQRVARPGSLVFIFSDFFSLDDDSERHLTRLRQHNDVIACQIWDTLELNPPPPGRYGISDGNHIGILDTGSAALRQRYEQYFLDHHMKVRDLLRRRAITLLRLATYEDVVDGLKRGLGGARAARPKAML